MIIQYEEEEYPIYCSVDSNLFSSKPVGEPVVVLHRFGGSYGEARFLMTTVQEELAGDINITLANAWGASIKVLRIGDIQIADIAANQQELLDLEILIKQLQRVQQQPPLSEAKFSAVLGSAVIVDDMLYEVQRESSATTPASQSSDYINQVGSSERQKFTQEFLELLDSKSVSGQALFVFISRILTQFRLNGIYDTAHVLNESYIRAIGLINNGGSIMNSTTWLKRTTYGIIRELSLESQRSEPYDLETDTRASMEAQRSTNSSEDLGGELEILKTAFQRLPSEDQKLLNLKVIQGLSWRQTCETLQIEGDGDYTKAMLRKRKERALRRLRKIYHSLDPLHFR